MWKKSYQESAADAAERPSKKGTKKKGKAGSSGVDKPTLISFLERSQERDQAFMEGWLKPRENTGKISRSFPWMPLLCSETSSTTLVKETNEHPF